MSEPTTTNPAADHASVIPANPVEEAAKSMPQPQQPIAPPTRVAPLQQLAQANFIRPQARLYRVDLEVNPGLRVDTNGQTEPTHLAAFGQALHSYLANLIDMSGGDPQLITEDEFVRMVQTILVQRVQQVREHRLGQRASANRVVLSRTLQVPAALVEIYSGIGEIYLEHHGYSYVPALPAVPAKVPDYYTVDPTIVAKYIVFVDTLNRRNLHRAATLPNTFEGTPYWVLRRSVSGHLVAVSGITGEGTPADGLLRAIIQIGDGATSNTIGFQYINGLDYISLRYSYFSMN